MPMRACFLPNSPPSHLPRLALMSFSKAKPPPCALPSGLWTWKGGDKGAVPMRPVELDVARGPPLGGHRATLARRGQGFHDAGLQAPSFIGRNPQALLEAREQQPLLRGEAPISPCDLK